MQLYNSYRMYNNGLILKPSTYKVFFFVSIGSTFVDLTSKPWNVCF